MTLTAKQPFGEVIASSLDHVSIQAWEWNAYPPYGAVIQIEEEDAIFIAIVDNIVTAPLDGSRIPTAYKKTDAELKAEHPHIFALLRTTITATMLGIKKEKSSLSSPTKPVSIHRFATLTSALLLPAEMGLVLQRIITLHEPHIADTLIQHYLQQQQSAGTLSGEFLRSLLTAYIETVGTDYKRIFNLNKLVQQL